jgi:hypothetical protein
MSNPPEPHLSAPASGFFAQGGPPPRCLHDKVTLGHRAAEPPPGRTLSVDLDLLAWETVAAIRLDLMKLRDASLAPVIGELDAHLRQGARR